MEKKWYQKGVVQAAMVTGGFLLIALIITGILTSHEESDGRVVITDVIINQQEEQKTCLIDFRVKNTGSSEGSISRVRFEVVEVERIHTLGFMEFSKVYDLDISNLEKQGDEAECTVSQVVEPFRSDRFGVVLIARNMAMGEFRKWLLKPSLVTNNGIVSAEPVEVWLPEPVEVWLPTWHPPTLVWV